MTVGAELGKGTTGVRGYGKHIYYVLDAVLNRRFSASSTWSTGIPGMPDPSIVTMLSSTNGGMFPNPSARETSVPTSLRRVHDQSGLTWDEIAGALGVSRRTVHNWLNGMVVSARYAVRLTELAQVVNQHLSAGDRDETRGRLIAPNERGVSALQRLVEQNTARPKVDGIPVPVLLVTAEPSGPPIPTRRSTKIRPPRLNPR